MTDIYQINKDQYTSKIHDQFRPFRDSSVEGRDRTPDLPATDLRTDLHIYCTYIHVFISNRSA